MKGLIFTLILSLFLTVAAVPASAQYGDLKIQPSDLKLKYQAYDGAFTLPCTAEFLSPASPYDFKVRCDDDKEAVSHDFVVHLAISMYARTVAPKLRVEILYWVDGEGATSWLSFAEPNALAGYEASQKIKGEESSLFLELDLETISRRAAPQR